MLSGYAAELTKRLPRTAAGATSAAPPYNGTEWQVRVGGHRPKPCHPPPLTHPDKRAAPLLLSARYNPWRPAPPLRCVCPRRRRTWCATSWPPRSSAGGRARSPPRPPLQLLPMMVMTMVMQMPMLQLVPLAQLAQQRRLQRGLGTAFPALPLPPMPRPSSLPGPAPQPPPLPPTPTGRETTEALASAICKDIKPSLAPQVRRRPHRQATLCAALHCTPGSNPLPEPAQPPLGEQWANSKRSLEAGMPSLKRAPRSQTAQNCTPNPPRTRPRWTLASRRTRLSTWPPPA
jgi:hypothetical protein